MAGCGRAPREVLAELAGVGDDDVGLAAAALAISALRRPGRETGDCLAHVGGLAADLKLGGEGDVHRRATSLAEVMIHRHSYRSDDRDDDDISNTCLMWVIDNRRGGAEALGILGIEAARQAGWVADMLSFPAHVLVRLEDEDGQRVILDPSAGWRIVDPPDMRALLKGVAGLSAELAPSTYRGLSNRDILVRLQDTAKIRLLRCGCLARALAVVEVTLLFAPATVSLWREAGMMNVRLGYLPAAVAALEQFLARTDNVQARRRIQELVQELRGRIEHGGM
jgi:regulator of sirC expression with transglutaminase-like and TPR domain